MSFFWEEDFNKKESRFKYRQNKRLANQRSKNYLVHGHPIWYPQYLKTNHWIEFKQKYKASGKPRFCLICKDKRYELHHVTYEFIGKENLTDVVPLCRRHHAQAHKQNKLGVPLAEAHLNLK